MVAHIFNPSTWEEETGNAIIAGWREEVIRQGGDRAFGWEVIEVRGGCGMLHCLSFLSAFTWVSDSRILLLRPVGIHTTFYFDFTHPLHQLFTVPPNFLLFFFHLFLFLFILLLLFFLTYWVQFVLPNYYWKWTALKKTTSPPSTAINANNSSAGDGTCPDAGTFVWPMGNFGMCI